MSVLTVILFFYMSIGCITGLKLCRYLKWFQIPFVVAILSVFWLPNLIADVIASKVKQNIEGGE